jgi:broad specificity phosphatase PhoE
MPALPPRGLVAPAGPRPLMFLVRHAMPAQRPEVPPEHWELNAAGHLAAAALARALPPDALLVASEEPKARQTVSPAGRVFTDARFNEVARDEPYDGDFRARRRAYLSGVDHPDWEPRHEVAARVGAGVTFWSARAAGRALVVASHGMALTLWLATAVDLPDPGAFWTDLRLPDLFELDPAARFLHRRSP